MNHSTLTRYNVDTGAVAHSIRHATNNRC